MGRKPEDITNADANKSMALSLVPAIVSVLLLAIILGFVQASTIIDALFIGCIVSAGFIGMSAFNLMLFEGRSFKLTLLNTGYSFVSLNVAAIILPCCNSVVYRLHFSENP